MFLTNFHEREKDKYIKAVREYKKKTGNNDIYIDNLQIFYRIQDELEVK